MSSKPETSTGRHRHITQESEVGNALKTHETGDSLVDYPVQAAPNPVLAMIERAARDPAVDMDKLERLLLMKERTEAREAEAAFNVSLLDAQKRIGTIGTNKRNAQTNSAYADYEKLNKIVRPIYTDCGFSLSFDTGDAPTPDQVRVLCYAAHVGGHTRTYKADVPADGKGAKGGDVMTKTHALGSGLSYGKRYLLKGIFNIATGEQDDDGNAAGETKYADWLAAIDGCTTVDELKARKVEMSAAFAAMIPKILIGAYNVKLKAIKA